MEVDRMNELTLKAIIELALVCKQNPEESLAQTLGNIYMEIEDGEYEAFDYENELCNLVQDLHAHLEGDDR